MHPNLYLLLSLVTTTQHVWCFYNLCHRRKNGILSGEECSELYFEPSEKETSLGHIDLSLDNNTLYITPKESSWNTAFLKISSYNDKSKKLCSKLSNEGAPNYCVNFTPDINETFLLEYKAEKLPETNSRKFLFSVQPQQRVPFFYYIDLTDTSRLILKAQKHPSNINITYYKVEGYKEKNNVTKLQDFRLFLHDKDIVYELYTYNDEGNYYFVVSVMSDNCADGLCLQLTTPTIFIGRKSTRLVIGIVGASFILPFVLFIFHILTKKYPIEENQGEQEEGIVVAYKSSFKKHNDVVVTLAALLEKFSKNQVNVDLIDLAKTSKKFPEKFCVDSLMLANRIIYVAPPRNDSGTLTVDKALSEKEIYGVIFDYCTDKLPQFFDNHKIFKLFEDFDKFSHALDISDPCSNSLYLDLRRKTEEAKQETDQYLNPRLPQIVVTDEPQESDSLIAPKIV